MNLFEQNFERKMTLPAKAVRPINISNSPPYKKPRINSILQSAQTSICERDKAIDSYEIERVDTNKVF